MSYNTRIILKKIITFCVLQLIVISAFGQKSIVGKVQSVDGNALDCFNIVLLTQKDSIFLQGSTFTGGEFEIKKIKDSEILVKISYVGYETKIIPVNFKEKAKINLGNIQLNPISLEKVIVTAKRPVYKLEDGKSIFYVKNSTLSNIGNLVDLLKYTPKLRQNADNEIEVIGKGIPVIYIDGRKINSQDNLKMLQSDEVEKIEIITNPSAKYDASGLTVLNIITSKNSNKGLSGSLKVNNTIASKYSCGAGANMAYNAKKIYLYGAYNYENNYSTVYSGFSRENISNNILSSVKYDDSQSRNDIYHTYKAGIDFNINKNQKIGFIYNGWNSDRERIINSNNQYYLSGVSGTIEINKDRSTFTNENAFNLNYHFDIDTVGQQLKVMLDYVNLMNKREALIEERESQILNKKSSRNINLNLYSLKIDYLIPSLFWDISIESGIKYTYTTSDNTNKFEEDINQNWTIIPEYCNRFKFEESIFAFYITGNKKIEKLTLNGGIRWEYYKTSGIIDETLTVNDIKLNTFFPSVSINYDFSENFIAAINYSKRIYRTSYKTLSPYVNYKDSYTTEQGNPALKPQFYNTIESNFFIMDMFEINFGYTYIKNYIHEAYIQDENNPNITHIIQQNYKKIEIFNATLMHNYSIPSEKWSMYTEFGISKPRLFINDHGSERKLNKPFIYISHSQELNLSSNFMLYANIDVFFPGEEDIHRYDPLYDLSVSLKKSFFKNKLIITVSASDILNTLNFKRYLSINNMVIRDYLDPDETSVLFSLTYKIGNKRSRNSQSRIGNEDEIYRLKDKD